ncbi:flagellar basal body protein [Oryzifoliimicrobium ureilyticus]|uniref:flagellar basal body protein n=1 Tax=Oryzifoliimicrobium ureilyticus TaxID=3113724 RepID=UPI0030761C42
MSIVGALNTASMGMSVQATRLAAASNNMANSSTPGYKTLRANLSTLSGAPGVQASVSTQPGQSSVSSDPSTDMLTLVESKDSFAANADVFEAGADMWQVLMSMKRD